jgi:hypothetical protein
MRIASAFAVDQTRGLQACALLWSKAVQRFGKTGIDHIERYAGTPENAGHILAFVEGALLDLDRQVLPVLGNGEADEIEGIAGRAAERLFGEPACVDIRQRKSDENVDVALAVVDESEARGDVFRADAQIFIREADLLGTRQHEPAGAKLG